MRQPNNPFPCACAATVQRVEIVKPHLQPKEPVAQPPVWQGPKPKVGPLSVWPPLMAVPETRKCGARHPSTIMQQPGNRKAGQPGCKRNSRLFSAVLSMACKCRHSLQPLFPLVLIERAAGTYTTLYLCCVPSRPLSWCSGINVKCLRWALCCRPRDLPSRLIMIVTQHYRASGHQVTQRISPGWRASCLIHIAPQHELCLTASHDAAGSCWTCA